MFSAPLLNKNSNEKPRAPVRETSEGARVAISIYLVTFLLVVTIWLLPDWTPGKWILTPYAWPVMSAMGWVQNWSLFAPDVREVNYHCTAAIDFADGTTRYYEFPRMQKLGLWHKFRSEKMRKLFGDYMPWPGGEPFLKDIARYLAAANSDPKNPPQMVTIMTNWHGIPKPDAPKWIYRDQLPEHTDKSITFVYPVTPQDLK